MKLAQFSLMAIGSLVLLTGCLAPTAGTRVESYNSDKIVETRFMVKKRLQVQDVRRAVKNGLLSVDIKAESLGDALAPLSSFGRKSYQYEYMFRWFDENQMEVESGRSTWTSVTVDARDVVRMQGTAPTPDAVDFEFVVRFPDRY